MHSASGSESDGMNRMVRFDSECILIPENTKRSKALTKSYSLPLWKRKPSSDSESETYPLREHPNTGETHVVFKVPIPRFISRSPSRGRNASSSSSPKPLSPCLVHRAPSSLPPGAAVPKPIRRSSLPICDTQKPKHDAAMTVPLRECCAKCEAITDECLKEGELWQEKFTRGARRRRSSSLDDGRGDLDNPRIGPSLSRHHASGFGSMVPNELTKFRPPTFSLTVDEVDKRRKSLELVGDDRHHPHATLSLDPSHPYAILNSLKVLQSDKESTASLASSSEASPTEATVVRRVRSSPIQEEDEDQLFPLPSPRRSPNGSPSVSPSPSTGPSPAPSPSNSESCLSPPTAGVPASKDDIPQVASNLNKSALRSRRSHTDITAQSSGPRTWTAKSSRLQHPASISDLRALGRSQTSGSPPFATLTRSPSLSAAHNSTISGAQRLVPLGRRERRPIEVPSGSTDGSTDPDSITTTRPTARSTSRSSRPSSPANKSPRIPSFSIPFWKDVKGAGADVLKGVSAMAGGGTVV